MFVFEYFGLRVSDSWSRVSVRVKVRVLGFSMFLGVFLVYGLGLRLNIKGLVF